jgi:hypothetical protein
MLPAGFVAAYGSNKGDVKNFDRCMKAAAELGRQMVKIIEKKFTYPEGKANYIAFGTHTF